MNPAETNNKAAVLAIMMMAVSFRLIGISCSTATLSFYPERYRGLLLATLAYK